MPINLDSCITGIFVPGNIGASSGLPPVQPVIPTLIDPDDLNPETTDYALDFSKPWNSFYAGAV